MPVRRPLRLLLLLALTALATPTARAGDSPFLPPATAETTAPKNAAAGYEFVGVTAVGKETLLSFVRLADKRSAWIPLGKTINEITVVSYDAKTDTAVIKADNQTLTLTLRKGAVVAGSVNPLPPTLPPPGPGAPPPPAVSPASAVPNKALTVQEEKELEARMLVTDLLEIGQQQRKAYEAAQREAAQRAANPKMPPAAPATATKP